MLYLVGIGLDKDDISLKGINVIKKCKFVYIDTYTSTLPCSVRELEKIIGKKVIEADRKLLEDKDDVIVGAIKGNVALLISGDPLAATTHIDLVLRARKKKIKVEIIHSTSVFTAITETGLQLYKFGKTASIPKWQPSYRPESFYDIIKENLKIDAHTLLLLDIGLNIPTALSQIKKIAENRKDNYMLKRDVIICERIGTANSKVVVGNLNKFLEREFKSPYCIIIPSKLHFLEAEALKV